MNKFEKMIASATDYMIYVMKLNKEDAILIVTDELSKSIADAFHEAAVNYGCAAEIYFLPEKNRPLSEIPPEMSELAKGKTIIINIFKGMGEETPFRSKWIKQIIATKSIRLAHGPSITKSMMVEGPMNIDYEKMGVTADKLIKNFENAKVVHVTAPGGTDIIMDIEDRAFSTDVRIVRHPYFANLPCGEIWCGPNESCANGMIVCDGSIGDLGKVKKPLKISVKNGKMIKLESKDQKLVKQVEKLTNIDDEARIIGELGIGLNPGARLSGILLEDEKALNTAHIAFGNNEEMKGGQNKSKTHRDFLFYNPTMIVTYKDGSKKVVINNGEFCF